VIEIIQNIYKLVLGLCIGSFLNVVIFRLPQEISIINPRSFCPNCKNKIIFRENIPIISWILLKGKCSFCGKGINIRYPLIEILTGILFFVFSESSPEVYNFNQNLFIENIFSWLFLSILLVISFIDIDHFWVPQSLINFGLLSGFINLCLIGIINNNNILSIYLFEGLIASIVSYLFFEIIRISAKIIYKRDALGKGDSKLVSMISIWLGPLGITLSVGISYVISAVLIIILLKLKKIQKGQMIPFAPFLSIGGLIIWYFGNQPLLRFIYSF